MAMTESWFGDVLERKYLTTLTFNGTCSKICGGTGRVMIDPNTWSDAESLDFPGTSWKSLNLLDAENMIHARIVHRSGAAPVTLHHHHHPRLTIVVSNPII